MNQGPSAARLRLRSRGSMPTGSRQRRDALEAFRVWLKYLRDEKSLHTLAPVYADGSSFPIDKAIEALSEPAPPTVPEALRRLPAAMEADAVREEREGFTGRASIVRGWAQELERALGENK